MRHVTTAAAAIAILGIMFVANITNRSAGSALALVEGYTAPTMPIDKITLAAKALPVQRFDAF